ncbi:MAG: hypothetical protein ABSH00_04300 [Bryobacteraceae bacterium]
MTDFDGAKSAVIRVGHGRGFVVEGKADRFVITAAHCLPRFPPCATISYPEERTYRSLLGPLGKKTTVWAECLFADPIGDIAVLGSPDNQKFIEQAEHYEAMVDEVVPLSVSEGPPEGPAWLLSLDGRWFQCKVEYEYEFDGPYWISELAEKIRGGMSGSPILAKNRSAIGIVCSGVVSDGEPVDTGPEPRLSRNLPGWIWRDLNGLS